RELDRDVEVRYVDQVEPADLLRRLGERSIGHHPVLPRLHAAGRLAAQPCVADDPTPSLADGVREGVVVAEGPVADLLARGLPAVKVAVAPQQYQAVHWVSLSWRDASY